MNDTDSNAKGHGRLPKKIVFFFFFYNKMIQAAQNREIMSNCTGVFGINIPVSGWQQPEHKRLQLNFLLFILIKENIDNSSSEELGNNLEK